ncbi:MAG: DUF6056 family protein [Elusimicrobiaceae bacterium]
MSEDEMLCPVHNLDCYFWTFVTTCARIGGLIGFILIQGYKWLFLVVNPLAQLALVLAVFYLIHLRMPNFKTLADIPSFVIIALSSIFLVTQPDQTIFWFAGSANYLMLGVMFMAFCAVLRKTWHCPNFLPSNSYTRIGAFFIGIILGMNNENSAPMIFCLCGLYTFLAIILKKKIPSWFPPLFIGVAAGLALMFSSPAYHIRTNINFIVKSLSELPLYNKFFHHLYNMNDFMASSLYILPIICIVTFVCVLDKWKQIVKNENFFLLALSCFVSFVLALVLFPLPIRPHRACYSASLFTIVALLFFIKYIKDTYKRDLAPYIMICLLLYIAFIIVPFTKPYLMLYEQSLSRKSIIDKALQMNNNICIYTPLYYIPQGPSTNLTIVFFDVMKGKHYYADKYYNRTFVTGKEPPNKYH